MKTTLLTVGVLVLPSILSASLQAEDPSQFRFSMVNSGHSPMDTTTIVTHGKRVIFTINKERGNGTAQLELVSGKWPEEFIFCFEGFREMRTCELTIDNRIFKGHILRQFGQLQYPHNFELPNPNATQPPTVLGPPGSPTITRLILTGKGNNLEVTLKVAVNSQKVKKINIHWVEKLNANQQQFQRNGFTLDVF